VTQCLTSISWVLSASGQQLRLRLQVLCFLNEGLEGVDWRGNPTCLRSLQQAWPEIGDFIIALNPETPLERVWFGEDIVSSHWGCLLVYLLTGALVLYRCAAIY